MNFYSFQVVVKFVDHGNVIEISRKQICAPVAGLTKFSTPSTIAICSFILFFTWLVLNRIVHVSPSSGQNLDNFISSICG